MSRALEFDTYRAFRREMTHGANANFSDAIEELAADIYHAQVDAEFDSMWDSTDDDD